MLFKAEFSDFRMIYQILKSISFKDHAIFRPMEEGLKITLEEMKHSQTLAFLPSAAFNSFYIKENEDVVFKIGFKVFVECLNIYGDEGGSSVKISYKEVGSPLHLVIKHAEENITTDCEIKTINADDYNDMSLVDQCNLNKIVIEAKIFEEILQRLDQSADEIIFSLSQDPPCLTLQSEGLAGESKVDISENTKAISIFQCQEPFSFHYSFTHIRQILKVIHLATKIAISTGPTGLLGFQLLINSDDRQLYVEYYVTPQFTEDE